MLTHLSVENLAVIKSCAFDPAPGLTVFTGSTGTGKSLLLGAIGLLIGDRAATDLVRSGEPSARVFGIVRLPHRGQIAEILAAAAIPSDGELLLRREFGDKGSKVLINDVPVTLNTLKDLGRRLVDLVGQHQHQSLLYPQNHLTYLDAAPICQAKLPAVREAWDALTRVRSDLAALRRRVEQSRRDEELMRFQAEEIDRVAPLPGEDDALAAEQRRLAQSARLLTGTQESIYALAEEEGGPLERVGLLIARLHELAEIDPALKETVALAESARASLQEVERGLEGYLRGFDIPEGRLEWLNERLFALSRLSKKYGGPLSQVLTRRVEIESALRGIIDFEDQLLVLQESEAAARRAYSLTCADLSAARAEAAQALTTRVEAELADLGMPGVRFRVALVRRPDPSGLVDLPDGPFAGDATGAETAEFFLEANPGEGEKPLARSASGGELSRIMLALKIALADADDIPILVFDEVDSGLGGEAAERVGLKLRELAGYHQVLVITHLHQIAAFAERHFTVSKREEAGRTFSEVVLLEREDRVEELARMMGGEEITPSVRKAARELLNRNATSPRQTSLFRAGEKG